MNTDNNKSIDKSKEASLVPKRLSAALVKRSISELEKLDKNAEAEYWFQKGRHAKSKRDNYEKISYFTKAINIKPDYAEAYYYRGRAECDNDKAIADFSKVLELDPNWDDVYYWRGRMYFDKSDYDEALMDFSKAIELDPNWMLAYQHRAMTYEAKGQDDKAIADYSKAIRLDPNLARTSFERGLPYSDGHYKEKLARAYYRRGLVYDYKGDYDKAIEYFSKAIELNSRYPISAGVHVDQPGDRLDCRWGRKKGDAAARVDQGPYLSLFTLGRDHAHGNGFHLCRHSRPGILDDGHHGAPFFDHGLCRGDGPFDHSFHGTQVPGPV